MKSKVYCEMTLSQEEISKGDAVFVNVSELLFTQNGKQNYFFELEHSVDISKGYSNDDVVSSVEVAPKINDESVVRMMFDYWNKDNEKQIIEDFDSLDEFNQVIDLLFREFLKDKLFISYDYGDEKIVWSMLNSLRETHLDGRVCALMPIFKFHIKDGIVSNGKIEGDVDWVND